MERSPAGDAAVPSPRRLFVGLCWPYLTLLGVAWAWQFVLVRVVAALLRLSQPYLASWTILQEWKNYSVLVSFSQMIGRAVRRVGC